MCTFPFENIWSVSAWIDSTAMEIQQLKFQTIDKQRSEALGVPSSI